MHAVCTQREVLDVDKYLNPSFRPLFTSFWFYTQTQSTDFGGMFARCAPSARPARYF